MAQRRQQIATSLGRPQIAGRQPEPEVPASAPISLPLSEAREPETASLSAPDLPNCTHCGTHFARKRKRCSVCQTLAPWAQKPVTPPPNPLSLAEQRAIEKGIPASLTLSDDSVIRTKALQIVMMESTGMSRADVAVALGLSPKTIAGYLYKAGKNGWLEFTDPKDQLEYRLMHKVIRNLDEGLDDQSRNEKTGMTVATQVALQIADGALYPKLESASQQPASTVVGIKIEIVGGDPGQIREGTVMGTSRYIDAEPVE